MDRFGACGQVVGLVFRCYQMDLGRAEFAEHGVVAVQHDLVVGGVDGVALTVGEGMDSQPPVGHVIPEQIPDRRALRPQLLPKASQRLDVNAHPCRIARPWRIGLGHIRRMTMPVSTLADDAARLDKSY